MELQGTIDVAGYMRAQEAQREWVRRRARDVEWYALKEYWKAEEGDKPKVRALYGQVLERALIKRRTANDWLREYRKCLSKNGC